MDLDHNACYRVFQARDARFDGRVFIGVRTTGIYCRPICPARTPKQTNVDFFASAAAAQDAGFRPCLRCRPEVAPELAAWNGTSNTVTRALRLIESSADDESDIDVLAERLGIGDRQLRRLFARHIGASPSVVLHTRRVHLAKQLIQETDMPMAQVAHASGFGSIRRFNETFKNLFGRPPTELRRSRTNGSSGDVQRGITLRLAYSPPYAWDEMLAFLRMRAIAGVEHIGDDTYVRSISMAGVPGVIAIGPGRPREMTLRVHCSRMEGLSTIISRVRSMFDLGADPRTIDAHLSTDRVLAPLITARPGLRVAGSWTAFELAVRAVLGQQITVRGARALGAQLVAACGSPLDSGLAELYEGISHLFPAPTDLVHADANTLGMPRARASTLQTLARTVNSTPSVLGPHRSLQEAVQVLTSLPGIGPWTAQYIAMRELREPDAFPATDAALVRAMETLLGREVSPTQLLDHAERWRPWRAYGAAHLWASLRSAPSVRGAER